LVTFDPKKIAMLEIFKYYLIIREFRRNEIIFFVAILESGP